MAASTELIGFVKEGLQRGISKDQLDDALRRAGWDRQQAAGAIRQFADVEFPIPVPRPTPYVDAREAFMYVVMFFTLYFSAHHLVSLVFELINLAFPDSAAHRYAALASEVTLRWAISAVVVGFPVFLYVAWLIERELRADVSKRASRVRRQLTYLTLFIAATVLIGDFTTLIYNFLGGELSQRFLLKVLTVALIAGTGFGYYLRQLRKDDAALAS
jgi:hypothetical protein